MNNESEYIKIDLAKVINGLLRRAWIIILCMLLCGGLLLSYAVYLVTPMYESSVLMYVNNSSFSVGATSFSISSSEISAAKSLVDTYLVILKTRMTLEDVIELGQLDYSYSQLTKMITAEPVNDTEVFSVTVKTDDPYEAERIANTIAIVLPEKINDVVEGSSVRIVDYAVVASGKVSPSIPKYTIIGMLLGAMISCLAIAIAEITDNQIRSEDYLLEAYPEIPLLSVVPDMLSEKHHDNYYYYNQYAESEPGKKKEKPANEKKKPEKKSKKEESKPEEAKPERHPRAKGKKSKGGLL